MKKIRWKSLLVRVGRIILPALLTGSLVQCGLNAGPIAGGSSEVGNPESAIYRSGKKDTTSKKVTGVEINFMGGPIRILHSPSKPDSLPTSISVDSNTNPSLPIGE